MSIYGFLFIILCVDVTTTLSLGLHRSSHRKHHRHGFLASNIHESSPQQKLGTGGEFGGKVGSMKWRALNSELDHHKSTSTTDPEEFPEFLYHGPLGPEYWPTLFPNCSGSHQSPIAIEKLITKNARCGRLSYSNFYVLHKTANITNNGHTAMITLSGEAFVSGGDLPAKYRFLNFHFHWGSDSTQGSEHTLDGIRYPLELHLVHWNQNYKSSEEAMLHKDGIAVFAVFFQVQPFDNPMMKSITNALHKVIPSGSSVAFKANFRLSDMLPSDTRSFYRYYGSLTTPECNESVIWTVFSETLPISESQLKEFRKLLDVDNHSRKNNYRPVQPINHRIIYRN